MTQMVEVRDVSNGCSTILICPSDDADRLCGPRLRYFWHPLCIEVDRERLIDEARD